MFIFRSLLGAQSDSPAIQSLLEFDGGVKILIDVGWDECFQVDKLQQLEKETPTISLILFTHPTLAHIGAYAHCCKHIPAFSRIPVYATTPVISLGRTLIQDLYNSTPLASSTLPTSVLDELTYSFPALKPGGGSDILLPAPSADEIAEYFNAINSLKFSQRHRPTPAPNSPPLEGLTITAHSAGHSLGGTLWSIQHGSESVIYAVDWNQVRENVLAGAAWLGGSNAPGSQVVEQLRQPSALICSSKGCQSPGLEGGLSSRDSQLIHNVRATIEKGGTVLIPSDSSARSLEIAFLLERTWNEDESLRRSPLYMASTTSGATMRYARSMLEWMDESVVREFESRASTKAQGGRDSTSPFDFKHVKLLERKTQVARALAREGSKVFLASDSSLNWGFSRDLFEGICGDEKNLVLVPDNLASAQLSKGRNSLRSGQSILSTICQRLTGYGNVEQLNETTTATKAELVALDSSELSLYQQYLARQRQRQNAIAVDKETAMESSADVLDDQSSSTSSSEASDDELQGKALNTFASLTHSKQRLGATDEELGINILLRKKDVHDFDVRGKRGRERMFPFTAKRRRADEFGDLIRPEEYLRAEEQAGPEGQDAGVSGKGNAAFGQKRKFATQTDVMSSDKLKRRKSSSGAPIHDRNANMAGAEGDDVSVDTSEESEYEPEEAAILGPRKAVFSDEELQIKVRVVAIDFSGIHDQRSLHMLIPLIKPRRVILIAGSASETATLKSDCERLLGTSMDQPGAGPGSEVFAPLINEPVDASVDTDAWTIKLSPALVRTLHWQHFRDMDLVTVNGKIEHAMQDEEDDQKLDAKRLKTNEPDVGTSRSLSASKAALQEEVLPILASLSAAFTASAGSLTESIHVGDLRLSELRNILRAEKYSAEFRGEGVLLIDGYVTVRKDGVGRIEVEGGGVSTFGSRRSAFNTVKQKIYEGLAVVSAR